MDNFLELDAFRDIIDGLEELILQEKVYFADLTRKEFTERFIHNKKLVAALADYWKSFALNFPQLTDSEVNEVDYATIPPSEKLARIFQKIYLCGDDVTITQIISSFTKTMSVALVSRK